MIIYRGGRRQRGHGIGGVFKNLFRSAMPMIKEGGKIVAKNALNLGANVLADMRSGENNVGKAFERHAIKTAMETAEDMVNAGEKAVNKRSKRKGNAITSRQAKRLKGRKFADIYDD